TEETGLTPAGPFVTLKPLRQKRGEMVHVFAMEADFDFSRVSSNQFEMEWPPRPGKTKTFPEVDRLAYFNLTKARRKILLGQRAFIDELILHLKAGGKSFSA